MEESSINPNSKPYNLDQNTEAAIANLPYIGLFTSIAVLLMEKENQYVKFYAIQGLLFGISWVLITAILGATFILAILIPLVNIAAFVVWLILAWKAYNGEKYELPILGKIANDQLKK